MYIDGIKIDFKEIQSLNEFPKQIKKSNYFNLFIQQLEIKLNDYKHNTNDAASKEYLQKIIYEIRLNLSKTENCDLKLEEILQIQNIVELAVIGGSIVLK
jgi:hypothetical protein